ncbi:hypothetical protein B0H14DRAFT_3153397 [Mycena olivaceomarginata]|nr:hypothetical protein B0H14DRAFT_3153397 [Mycena olivaceomarginata]
MAQLEAVSKGTEIPQGDDHSIPLLRIWLKTLTIRELRDLLHPTKLVEIFEELAPFTWDLLHTFPASPNKSRKQKSADSDESMPAADDDDWIDDPNDDPNLKSGDADPGNSSGNWTKEYPGFSRNPVFAILLAISMLAFVRNRATNIPPLILGLFFKISGTSSRVVLMLSNAGVCVSGRTIERRKIRITEDAIQLAVSLITSGQVFFIIFDNINIFLRKAQQRISNTNDMINATNSAVVAIDGVEAFTEADLAEQLALRGRCAKAQPQDILPTPEDDEIVGRSFVFLIAEMIVSFTPENSRWKDRKDIAAAVADMMPKDRPLPPTKTDAQPFGVFDGGPRSGGFLLVTGCPQTTSVLLAEIERTILMPWSTSTSHMLMRTHYGHAVEDPASLAAHKGLLNRKWDVNKPNYAAAKSLTRHSLIARILHCVILKLTIARVINGFTLYSQLSEWRPTLKDIKAFALTISTNFATATAAKKAQAAGDDWMAHSIYFILVSFSDPGQLIRVLKYWGLAFRGVGQHNYARECAEVLVRWRYELPDKLRLGLERSWFISRWGIRGRSIAADLYLEQLNYWVKRVFIASGSGVTIEYIMRKGSACVEAFRDITHLVANFFGDPDRARRSKEVKFNPDIEALVTEMQRRKFHVVSKERHFVPAPPKKPSKKPPKNPRSPEPPRSAIVDVFVLGAEQWNGKFTEFIKATTFDAALGGYPVAVESSNSGYTDLHGDADGIGAGALGGGGDFDGVE